jgi:hypothetical protein
MYVADVSAFNVPYRVTSVVLSTCVFGSTVPSRPPALPRPVGFATRGVRVTVVVNVFAGAPCNEGQMFRLRWFPVHNVVIGIIVDAFGLHFARFAIQCYHAVLLDRNKPEGVF